MLNNRFDLRAKHQPILVAGIVHGLNAEMIARDQQKTISRIPDRKAEHAAQIRHAVHAIFFIEMDKHFRIADAFENMPSAFQVFGKGSEVIDFSIENNDNAAIFVVHGLLAAAQIDDAQAAHSHRKIAVEIGSFVIWPAMANDLQHIAQNIRLNRFATTILINTTDSAHSDYLSL